MKPIDFRNSTFEELQSRLHGMRICVWQAWQKHGPCTTRELAERSGMSILSVRPRTTEIYQLRLLRVEGDGAEGIYSALSSAEVRQLFVEARREPEAVQRQLPLAV